MRLLLWLWYSHVSSQFVLFVPIWEKKKTENRIHHRATTATAYRSKQATNQYRNLIMFLWRRIVACNVDGIILNITECNDRYAYPRPHEIETVRTDRVLFCLQSKLNRIPKNSQFSCFNYYANVSHRHWLCVTTSRKDFTCNFIADYIYQQFQYEKKNYLMFTR